MRPRLLLLPALSLLLHVHPGAAADKTLIRQHWEAGKVYHIETSTDMEMAAAAVPGVAGGQNTSTIQQIHVTVAKEPGSDRKLAEMKFTAIKAIMNMAGQMLTYDSADPAMSQPMLQQAFGAMVGKSITLIYDKDDTFVDVIVPEGFTPTPLGQAQGPDGKQFANMLRQSMDFGLPTEPVAVGGTFELEKKVDLAPFGAIVSKIKGRFDSVVDHEGRKHARLLTEGTMEMPNLPPDAASFVSISPGAKVSSEVLFDLERKAVSKSTSTTDMKMSVAGREMGMKQTVVSTLKSIQDAPAKK